jgi:hypothetical protein
MTATITSQACRRPYRVVTDDLISVCMICHPGKSIFRQFPELEGKDISHGICPAHRDQMLAELKALAP